MLRGATYGAEFEMADWDRRRPLLKFIWGLDERDHSMVNSCGVAVCPRGKLYHLGGEWLTSPAEAPSGVADQLAEFIRHYPEASVNYRSNLHVHVRVPNLREDLAALKRLQSYCAEHLMKLLPLLEPIPEPRREDYPDAGAWRGARARYARRRVSHQRIMPTEIVTRQLRATTPRKFFEAEALHVPTGRLLWATKPRCAINLRQLLQTDTVEFRHFPGTINPREVLSAVEWCREFMMMALGEGGDPYQRWYEGWSMRPWSSFRPYDHSLETRYRATSAHEVGVAAASAEIARLRAEGVVP